jgi:hypothetical protein
MQIKNRTYLTKRLTTIGDHEHLGRKHPSTYKVGGECRQAGTSPDLPLTLSLFSKHYGGRALPWSGALLFSCGVLNGGSPPPFIGGIEWFPVSLSMETFTTILVRAQEIFPPKLVVPGRCPSLAEPPIGPNPR